MSALIAAVDQAITCRTWAGKPRGPRDAGSSPDDHGRLLRILGGEPSFYCHATFPVYAFFTENEGCRPFVVAILTDIGLLFATTFHHLGRSPNPMASGMTLPMTSRHAIDEPLEPRRGMICVALGTALLFVCATRWPVAGVCCSLAQNARRPSLWRRRQSAARNISSITAGSAAR